MTEIGADEWGPPLEPPFRVPAPGTRGGFMFHRTPTHYHRGIDLGAPVGRHWLAIANGVIEHAHAGPFRGFFGYGRVVVLRFTDTDGQIVRALYAHGSEILVAEGSTVRRGDKLGKVGRSAFKRGNPADDGTMGAHLHFELARKRYPMGSEDRARIDPWGWFRDRGVPLEMAAPADPAGRPPVALALEQGHVAKQQVRDELLARLIRTDVEIAVVVARLEAAGDARRAAGLRAVWQQTRERLLPLLQAASTLEQLRAIVLEWLERIEAMAADARAAGGRVVASGAATVAASTAAAQRRLWEAGGWLDPSWVRDFLADTAKKFAAGLVVVGLLYLWWRSRK